MKIGKGRSAGFGAPCKKAVETSPAQSFHPKPVSSTLPSKPEVANWQQAQGILPGSLAAYWRWSKKGKGRKRGGYVLGRLLNHDPDQKSAWIHNGSSVVQVTYEQLRPAFGIENWTPTTQDIQILKDGAAKLQKDLWEDERGPGPSAEEPFDIEMEAPAELVLPLAPPPSEQPPTPSPQPATPAPLPQQQQLAPLPLNAPEIQQQQPQPVVYSPTYNQRTIQNIHQHFGPSRSTARSRTTPYTSNTQQTTTAIQAQTQPQALHTGDTQQQAITQQDNTMQQPNTTTIEDNKDDDMTLLTTNSTFTCTTANDIHNNNPPYAVWMTDHFLDDNFQITPIPDSWDGRPELPVPEPCRTFRTLAAEIINEPVSSDSSDDEERKEPSSLAKMTRQERKAMDREIPWRQIMKADEQTINSYVEANVKEYQSWMSWGSIRSLSDKEIQDIKNNPALKRRIIPSRNAYRDKEQMSSKPSVERWF